MSKRETGGTNGAETKLSRRTFAKTSVAAGTAAVALPNTLLDSAPAKAAPTKTAYRVARVEMPAETGGYNSNHEGGPNGFVNWYMNEVVKAGD